MSYMPRIQNSGYSASVTKWRQNIGQDPKSVISLTCSLKPGVFNDPLHLPLWIYSTIGFMHVASDPHRFQGDFIGRWIQIGNANLHHDPVGCLVFRTHLPVWLFLLFLLRKTFCHSSLAMKEELSVDLTSKALKMLKVQPPTDLHI